MNPARPTRCLLVLACLLSPACDEDPGVEEVDRGAKPIEGRRAEIAPLVLHPEVELEAVHVVASGKIDGVPFTMIADEDGAPTVAVTREGDTVRWLDVRALENGRLERLAARPVDLDAEVATLVQRFAAP